MLDIQKCCHRHNVKYAYFPSLFHNIYDMLCYIKTVGMKKGISEIKEHAH